MVSISKGGRYSLPAKDFFKAADLQGGDLVLQIDYVEFDYTLGGTGKFRDLLHFTNDERVLPVNSTIMHAVAALLGDETDLWPGGWIAIYHDPTVKYEDKITGGIRVRPFVPKPEDGAMPTKEPGSVKSVPKSPGDGGQSAGQPFDDTPF